MLQVNLGEPPFRFTISMFLMNDFPEPLCPQFEGVVLFTGRKFPFWHLLQEHCESI